MQPKRFVYVIQSDRRADRHYVGVTWNVTSRLAAHNAGASPHTQRHRPWRLRAVVEFADEARAIEFQKFLKSGTGAAFIHRLL